MKEKSVARTSGKAKKTFLWGSAGFPHGGGAASLGVLLKVGSREAYNYSINGKKFASLEYMSIMMAAMKNSSFNDMSRKSALSSLVRRTREVVGPDYEEEIDDEIPKKPQAPMDRDDDSSED